ATGDGQPALFAAGRSASVRTHVLRAVPRSRMVIQEALAFLPRELIQAHQRALAPAKASKRTPVKRLLIPRPNSRDGRLSLYDVRLRIDSEASAPVQRGGTAVG